RRGPLVLGIAIGGLALGTLATWAWMRAPPKPPPEAAPASAPPDDDKQARLRARLLLSRAEEALAAGELDESRAAAKEALALDEDYPAALRVLAVVEQRAGRAAEACRLMREYVGRAATPEPARAHLLATACGEPSAP